MQRKASGSSLAVILLTAGLVLILHSRAEAYIGPGAGFAALGSFLVMFTAMASAAVALVTWPMRYVIRAIRSRRAHKRARVRRVVVLGLDGMDPNLTDKYLSEGKLPNLAKLAATGSYHRLGTTLPPLSPVAWSTFQTGSNPGKHNIFDFLTCDRRTYKPKLSSVHIGPPRRTLRLGGYRIPLGKPEVRLLRKGEPFWSVLGRHGIFSNVIRVPITFPPEKFHGVSLSAMCVPDLRGSQGTFSVYATQNGTAGDETGNAEQTGGERFTVTLRDGRIEADLVGPDNPIRPDAGAMTCPFTVTLGAGEAATIAVNGQTHTLRLGQYTDWVRVEFKAGLGVKVRGICQFLLVKPAPQVELYVTPIQIDPEKPAMPISHPPVYATYLAKNQGLYATLGLAEDTWGLSAGVLTDRTFLAQCLQADTEREAMFFDALETTRRGLVVCVFDGMDRIQHTFWRYIDENHPADAPPNDGQCREAIPELYQRADALVGETLRRCGDDGTLMLVISDHGYNAFRYGVDLNAWLRDNGYLVLRDDAKPGAKYLDGVDWSKTTAYAIGLAGIFLNVAGREAEGIVQPGDEADRLRDELVGKLTGLVDANTNEVAILRAYNALRVYQGPYKEGAPDLIVGYNRGYRVAWEAAVGQLTDAVFHPNTKPWSGDHCVDPSVVPGVLFSNYPIASDGPRLMDVGPTVLDLFGVRVPKHMDGRPLAVGDRPHGEANR